MFPKKLEVLLVMIVFSGGSVAQKDAWDRQDIAQVSWDSVAAPVGRFLLIRQEGRDVCAIRFLSVRRSDDRRPQTIFSSGDESFSGEYEWWLLSSGEAGDNVRDTQNGKGVVSKGSLVGIGRLAFRTGQSFIHCGSFSLWWDYPARVRFYGAVRQGDYGVEIAPTGWKSLSEINLREPNLKWYRYEEMRGFMGIPLDSLPGYIKDKDM